MSEFRHLKTKLGKISSSNQSSMSLGRADQSFESLTHKWVHPLSSLAGSQSFFEYIHLKFHDLLLFRGYCSMNKLLRLIYKSVLNFLVRKSPLDHSEMPSAGDLIYIHFIGDSCSLSSLCNSIKVKNTLD